MKKKRISLTISCAVLVVFLCAGLMVTGYVLVAIPNQAAEVFGPPSGNLDFLQRVRLSTQLLWRKDVLIAPGNPFGEEQDFQVEWGETLPSITARLQSEGLIPDSAALNMYLRYSGLDTSLQAGKYQLNPSMTPLQIAQELQDATPTEIILTILKGWRLEEIGATLPTSGLEITPEEFQKRARKLPEGYSFLSDAPSNASLEGFLAPGSYVLPRETGTSELITTLLDTFESQLTLEIQKGFTQQDLNIFEGVTLASIVQRESVDEDEMPIIASVFLNRLALGMKLEADSTVQYALGYNSNQNTWWTNPLSTLDLQVNSRYNTYDHPGLPPGPISNPGVQALRAVAFPAQTPYYYFRALCDGSGKHVFSQTFEEHVGNECTEKGE
jgi:UPF0755 protein